MIYIYTMYAENPKKISHAFLENILKNAFGISDPLSKLYRDAHGKPYVDGAIFSLSHSKNAICVALYSEDEPKSVSGADIKVIETTVKVTSLGVDIESISDKSVDRCKRIAASKFFENEQDYLEKSKSDTDYVESFCQLWTKKESYSKFTAIGMKDALSFDTQILHSDVQLHTEIITLDFEKYAISLCYNA